MLRYYERAGLMLRRVGRAPSSHRRYTADDVRWIVLLTRLRATGMPIRRVREYAALRYASRRANEPVPERLRRWIPEEATTYRAVA